jgi:hypothetical protein
MEPTLAQIKEYVREKNIDVFGVLNIERTQNTTSLAFGDNQTEVYFAYYLEHSTEIVEWMKQELIAEEAVMNLR